MTSPRRVAWVSVTGPRVHAMSIARQRSGPQSWEVTHLFPGTRSREDDDLVGLLEGTAESAASHGGERVFLRVRSGDPLIGEARRGGFFPSMSETLFKRGVVPWGQGVPGKAPMRKMTGADEYDAFRLYNLSTPSEVRRSTASTFEQWKSCLEQRKLPWRCFVMGSEIALTGWAAVYRGTLTGWMSAIVSPDREGQAGLSVDGRLRPQPSERSEDGLLPPAFASGRGPDGAPGERLHIRPRIHDTGKGECVCRQRDGRSRGRCRDSLGVDQW